MDDISIARLSLDLPGFTAQRGERLARKIANGLEDVSLSRGPPADVSSLDISLRLAPDESDDALADRIVAELIRQLDRIA
jgi:hypothetical protein